MLHIVEPVRRAAGHGVGAAENIAVVGHPAQGHLEIEIVHQRRAGGGAARRIRPGQRHAHRLRRIGNKTAEHARLAAGSEVILGNLVAQHARHPVEGGAEIHLAQALIRRRQRVVGVVAREVARGVHQKRLGHRRTGRGIARIQSEVDEILAQQRTGAGHRRRRMAGAGGDRVKFLAQRKKIVRASHGAAPRQPANAGAVETRTGAAGAARGGKAGLRHAAQDVRAGRDQVRLDAAIGAGAAAGKIQQIICAVGVRVESVATVLAGSAAAAIKRGE